MSDKCDVLIVGAGPAGCAAAYDLAASGMSVLLLDRQSFPRLKPCAGALTMKTIRALRYSVRPIIRQTCRNFRVGLRLERTTVFPSAHPIAAMTVRSEFDEFCLRQTCRMGAQFHRITAISQISRTSSGWALSAGDHDFESRFLIGADGANSQVRKLCGLAVSSLRFGFALETCIPTSQANDYLMEMDYGVVDHGYAWVFPKGDHVNVGLFTLHPTIHQAGEQLAAYCKQKVGLPLTNRIHGHKIPYGGKLFSHAPGGAILVGDAAGLVDPLLGEGIFNAVRSGQLAAAAIREAAAGASDRYDQLVKEITYDLASYDFDTRMFYSHIDRGYRHLTLLPIRYALMKGFSLGLTFRSIKRKCLLLPLLRPEPRLTEACAPLNGSHSLPEMRKDNING